MWTPAPSQGLPRYSCTALHPEAGWVASFEGGTLGNRLPKGGDRSQKGNLRHGPVEGGQVFEQPPDGFRLEGLEFEVMYRIYMRVVCGVGRITGARRF